MNPIRRRAVLFGLTASLIASSLLLAGTALGHGGETGPGHHDDDVAGKQSVGAPGGNDSAGDDAARALTREGTGKPGVDGQPTSAKATGDSGGAGGGGSPVPHFIGLLVLAGIGAGLLLFRRNRQRHAAESG